MRPEFRWIEWNIDKVAKHGVFPSEAERVVCNAATPYPRRLDREKWQVVGRGRGDRFVQVIYLRDPDGAIFVIHAMPLVRRRRRGNRRR